MKYFIIVFLSLIISQLPAQTNDQHLRDFLNDFDQYKKALEKDFDKLNNSDFEKKIEKRFNDLINEFEFESFRDFFSEKHFNNFFEHFNKMNKNQGIAHKWIESKTERILVINVDVGKKDTLDIEINKKMVTVKIKKVEAKSSFSSNQSVSIPIDVDTSKAGVKNKDGKIMIIFPKINNKKIIPISPGPGDITI